MTTLEHYSLTEISKNEVAHKALRRCMQRNYKDFKMERRRLRMNDKNSMDRISPCGLHCGKCFAFEDGDIHAATMKLKENLGAFEPYALRFIEQLDPVFEKYPDFKEMLDYFANASCKGCRKEECKFYKNCNVRACTVEKGIDFCYECNEFPCEHSGLDKNLHKRSVTINRRIQKIGLDEYYEEVKNQPRY